MFDPKWTTSAATDVNKDEEMKMDEIASAEEQLALWKLINQSVWAAVEQQRIEQHRLAAQQRAQKAQKPSTKRTARAATVAPKAAPKVAPKQLPKAQPKPETQKSSVQSAAAKLRTIAPVTAVKPVPSVPAIGSTVATKKPENGAKTQSLAQIR